MRIWSQFHKERNYYFTHTHTHIYIYIYGERQQRLYCQKDDYGNGNIRTLNILYDKSIALILANLWTRNVHHKDESQHGNHVAYKAPPTCNHPAKPWLLSSRPKKKQILQVTHKLKELYTFTFLLFPGKGGKKNLIYRRSDPASCEILCFDN
jgi:hypothetical protein